MQITLYKDAYPIRDVMIYLTSISICFLRQNLVLQNNLVLEHEILLPESLKYREQITVMEHHTCCQHFLQVRGNIFSKKSIISLYFLFTRKGEATPLNYHLNKKPSYCKFPWYCISKTPQQVFLLHNDFCTPYHSYQLNVYVPIIQGLKEVTLTKNQISLWLTTYLQLLILIHRHIKELEIWFVKYKIRNLPNKNIPIQQCGIQNKGSY